ncbi:ROK family protein [Congregibacter sp.]|uniref:ROK family protein n=1 Tax=Congregibacter sp. TaxID=2744308 RepID=UPI003F6B47E4
MEINPLLLGVDLGGTKIEAALVDTQGKITNRLRIDTPKNDYEGVLSHIQHLCEKLESEAKLKKRLPIGICTPGSPSPATGLMRNCNSTVLNGRSLAKDLQDHTGRFVRIANDADCLALSEALDGVGTGKSTVFAVIIGTGVGGGIAIDGNLLQGPNAVSGEWGHNPMPLERVSALPIQPFKSRPCYCGRTNCIETWLSGPGLAQTHEDLHGATIEIDQLHRQQLDDKHHDTLVLYADMLSAALAGIVNIVDPEVIVLGGGLSNIQLLYRLVPQMLAGQVFSDVCQTELRNAEHGDSSGVRGAAWLWKETR